MLHDKKLYVHIWLYYDIIMRVFDKSLENISMKIQYNMKIQVLWSKIILIF